MADAPDPATTHDGTAEPEGVAAPEGVADDETSTDHEAPAESEGAAAPDALTEPEEATEPLADLEAIHYDVTPSTSDIVSDAVEEAASPDGRLVVGKSPGVTADDHVAEAGRKVMRFHLARMFARETGVRSGHDLEDVHAMRVATRRQRAAWRVFGAAFRPGRTRRYRTGLREIASRLGAVRDLDVLLEAADHYRADLPTREQRALEPLLADWRTHRDDARVLLIRELDSDGYRRWVDDYRDFVRNRGRSGPAGRPHPAPPNPGYDRIAHLGSV